MLTLTSSQAKAAGWRRQKSPAGLPSLIGPDGARYVRTMLGHPSLRLIADDGTVHLLSRVAYRSGDSLLRMLRQPRGSRA